LPSLADFFERFFDGRERNGIAGHPVLNSL
jgi:hypothetical protein